MKNGMSREEAENEIELKIDQIQTLYLYNQSNYEELEKNYDEYVKIKQEEELHAHYLKRERELLDKFKLSGRELNEDELDQLGFKIGDEAELEREFNETFGDNDDEEIVPKFKSDEIMKTMDFAINNPDKNRLVNYEFGIDLDLKKYRGDYVKMTSLINRCNNLKIREQYRETLAKSGLPNRYVTGKTKEDRYENARNQSLISNYAISQDLKSVKHVSGDVRNEAGTKRRLEGVGKSLHDIVDWRNKDKGRGPPFKATTETIPKAATTLGLYARNYNARRQLSKLKEIADRNPIGKIDRIVQYDQMLEKRFKPKP
jgi:hypothetical protein